MLNPANSPSAGVVSTPRHARSGGTAPRPRDDGIDFMRRACDDRLDAAVAPVSHPAAKLAGARLVGKRVAKSHALDASAYDQTQCDRISAAWRAHRWAAAFAPREQQQAEHGLDVGDLAAIDPGKRFVEGRGEGLDELARVAASRRQS